MSMYVQSMMSDQGLNSSLISIYGSVFCYKAIIENQYGRQVGSTENKAIVLSALLIDLTIRTMKVAFVTLIFTDAEDALRLPLITLCCLGINLYAYGHGPFRGRYDPFVLNISSLLSSIVGHLILSRSDDTCPAYSGVRFPALALRN